MQVVKSCLGVVDIAPVAQGVNGTQGGCHGAGGGKQVAPGIVGVADYKLPGGIENAHHITLEVGYIVVCCAVIEHLHGLSHSIVDKVQGVCSHRHAAEGTAVVDVPVSGCAVGALGAHTVGVVGVVPCGCGTLHSCQLSAVLLGRLRINTQNRPLC